MPEVNKTRRFFGVGRYISEVRKYAPLVILPLVLGIVLLLCVRGVIEREIEQQGNAVVMHFRSQADSVLREMELVSNAIISDGKFNEYINSDIDGFDPDYICGIVRQKLAESPYVSHAYVMVPTHDRIYTEKTFYPHDSFSVVLYELHPGDIADPSKRIASEIINIDAGWHISDVSYNVPYFVSDISLSNGQEAKLLVSTNMRSFLNTLLEPNTVLCCAFNDGVSFSSLLKNMPDFDWRSEQNIAELTDTKVKCFYVEGDNLTYLAAISTKEYYAPLYIIIYVFSAYFLAVIVFGWFYLRSVSERRYKNAIAMLDGIPYSTERGSSYNDVVSSINASLNEYRKEREFRLRTERRTRLAAFLSGTIAKPMLIDELKELGVRESEIGYYIAALIPSDGSRITVSGTEEAGDDLTCLIIESAISSLGAEKLAAVVTSIRGDFYAVLSVLDDTLAGEDLRTLLTRTTEVAEEKYALKLYVALSACVTDTSLFPAACDEAKRLRACARSIDSRVPVVLKEDFESGAGVLMNGDFLNELQILSRTLILGKYDMIPQMTEAILLNHVSRLRERYDLADERIRAVAGVLSEAIIASDFTRSEKDSALAALRDADSVSKLNSVTAELFGVMMANSKPADSDSAVEHALSYINEHLGDPLLSVPHIAEAADVSVAHLSRLFKKSMNRTIVDYINSLRIEKAKELLLSSDMTVFRVAETTGYSNVVTFTRNFNRYVGVSPSEFRSLNK